jgi:hypothetical protein
MRAVLPRSRPGRRAVAVAAAAVLAAGVVIALVHPGPRPADSRLLAAASAAPGYCTGTAVARFPAVNGVTNQAGTEGGHLWWRDQAGGTCIGTVVLDIRSGITTGTETMQVIVYDARHPGGTPVITDVIPAPEPGFYEFTFGLHRTFAGLTAACVGAVSCVYFGSAP